MAQNIIFEDDYQNTVNFSNILPGEVFVYGGNNEDMETDSYYLFNYQGREIKKIVPKESTAEYNDLVTA